jgi:transcription-repair coupling factor (superfamily II helicase)
MRRFPYEETDDQLSAIADVLEDLERGRPMDRLVVGDVGFGKTEVAMRAAFVAAAQGLQVAVIAPTTLLARQHAKTFTDRFRGFPVNVRQLSRFVPQKAASETKKGMADGSVDIVIGTHAHCWPRASGSRTSAFWSSTRNSALAWATRNA